MQIVSKKEAAEKGLISYYTGKPCKHGHLSERYVNGGGCISCLKEKNKSPEYKAWRESQKDSFREYSEVYRRENKESLKVSRKERYENNKDKVKHERSAYYSRNKHAIRERRRDYSAKYRQKNREGLREKGKAWARANPAIVNSYSLARIARKLSATPSWLTEADLLNIKAVHKMAARLEQCLGIKHHVDHIVPLKGKNVCGLHVPWNLRAIPAKLNILKGNKLLEDVQLI